MKKKSPNLPTSKAICTAPRRTSEGKNICWFDSSMLEWHCRAPIVGSQGVCAVRRAGQIKQCNKGTKTEEVTDSAHFIFSEVKSTDCCYMKVEIGELSSPSPNPKDVHQALPAFWENPRIKKSFWKYGFLCCFCSKAQQ